MRLDEITVVVEQPVDWVAGVLIPAAAILVAAGIALFVASFERRASERSHVRHQAAELIKATVTMGRAIEYDSVDQQNLSIERYAEELNAFSAMLNKRDIVVAKFVCVVVDKANRLHDDNGDGARFARTALWVSTAIELWLRGSLKSKEFEKCTPRHSHSWVESIDLGAWDAVVKGKPAIGVRDLPDRATNASDS